jgi:hypothetical protein
LFIAWKLASPEIFELFDLLAAQLSCGIAFWLYSLLASQHNSL